MIIRSVYIEKFGGLKNKKIDFKDGLNVLYLENEGGKSTVCEFIRVMLYGVNSLRFNQRKQYMPFGESVMGGEMTVEEGGTEYIIQRYFGKRKSDDSVSVYNKNTSEKVLKYCADNVGELLTGLGGDAFENTCYIKQLSCGINEAKTDEIQTKLINLSKSGNENYSYKNAISVLDGEIRELTKPRGKINKVQGIINELLVLRSKKHNICEEIKRQELELNELKNSEKSIEKTLNTSFLYIAFALFFVLFFVTDEKILFGFLSIVMLFVCVFAAMKNKKISESEILLAKKIGFLESNLKNLKDNFESIDISKLDEYNEKLKYYNKALSDLYYAKEKLSEAFYEISTDYAPKLNSLAKSVFSKITDEKYTDFTVNDKYEITLRDNNNIIVPGEYLSTGTYDQIYFSLRMALVNLIAPDMTVILDDSFAMYDDARLNNTLSYLSTMKNQILIFTCQKRETEF